MPGTVHTMDSVSAIQEGFGIMDWFRAIWTRRWLVLGLFLVFFIGGLAVISLFPPVFDAQAVLEVLPERMPNTQANPLTSAVSDTVSINTEAKKVGAEPVVWAVFQAYQQGKLGPVEKSTGTIGQIVTSMREAIDGWRRRACAPEAFGGRYDLFFCKDQMAASAKDREFLRFRSHLTVETEHATRLIRITYSAANPEVAARVANAIVAEYLSRHADETESQNNRYVSWLEGRLNVIGSQAKNSDQAVAEYRGKTGLVDMGQETEANHPSPTVEELSHTLRDLTTAEVALAAARVKLRSLEEVKADPTKMKSASDIVGSRLIQNLTLEEGKAEAKVAGMMSTYSAGSPVMVRGDAELRAIRARIATEIDRQLSAARLDDTAAAGVVDRLQHQAEALKARLASEQMKRVQLRNLERQAGAKSDLYKAYLRQAQEAIEAASWHPVVASIVASATPPVRPTFPNFRVLLPVGFVGSLSGAALIGALTELQRQRRVFNGLLDFKGLTGMRVVGALPWVRRPARLRPPENFKVAIESVAFRLAGPVENNRRQLGPGERPPPMAIAVTSAVADEGKSVLSVSLARQLYEDGAKVLIIDADIRRPSILKALGAEGSGSFSIVSCEPDGTGWDGSGAMGLHVITLADLEAGTFVLLNKLPRMIATLRQYYDVVVVDTPPLLAVSDAMAAIPCCDQIVFAVSWSSTPRSTVEYALQQLGETERTRTRIVLTKVVGDAGYVQYGPLAARERRRAAALSGRRFTGPTGRAG